MRIFEVGGCVRDSIIGRDSKDVDFSVEVESFDAMRDEIIARGMTIFVESPQFVTIRARDNETRETFDFVMCRKDGPSSDQRRPDFVEPGTLMDDLARRDFTMNAIARAEDGTIIDPFDGVQDIEDGIIRAVGDPFERFAEDGLRVARAIRFAIVFGFTIEFQTFQAMNSPESIESLRSVAIERVREEMEKAFRADTIETIRTVAEFSPEMQTAIFRDGLRASATMKG